MYTFRNSCSIAVNEPVQSNSAHRIVFRSEIDYIISECGISLKMLLLYKDWKQRVYLLCRHIRVKIIGKESPAK